MKLERQSSHEATFQSFGVDSETARQAGAIADRQAADPTYVLSNADLNIRNAAFQQMLQQQLEQQRQQEEENGIKEKVREYVLLMNQAQETESIGLIDAATYVKQQLLSEGLLTEAEFEKRVIAEDDELWVANPDPDDTDDAAFEARWRQETAGLGVPGNAQMRDHNPVSSDPMALEREERLREDSVADEGETPIQKSQKHRNIHQRSRSRALLELR